MSGSPWADPSTPTEPGPPYLGPPPTAQPYPAQPYAGQPPGAQPYPAQPYAGQPYAGQPYAGQPYATPYGYPAPYGTAPWGPPPPRRPQRPGPVITAAVLAFVQALVVLIASLYLWFFASIADVAVAEAGGVWSPGTVDALATEGTVLAIVQLLSAVALVGGGVWALNTRRRAAWAVLVAALGLQVLLAGYWTVRLLGEFDGSDAAGTVLGFTLFFAVGPLVGLGMLLAGPGRRWFGGASQP
ncbi:hypothetical protein [Blastococcus deserti]|uniref:Uncharacterized protein n=1 Tax=Blastococcus deserti TaxID=2259033 RepID=A0ABW4XA44_9ACTN